MDTWVSKIGFPVVTVKKVGGNSIHVRQDRFLETGPAGEEDNQTIWYVFRYGTSFAYTITL